MSLFSIKELGTAERQSKATISADSQACLSLRRGDQIADAVHALAHGQTAHWVSKGQWSMHELLELMLEKAGPSKVYMTTWTITEDPVRKLFMLKQSGLISELHCLLDYRIRDRKPEPFQLLQGIASSLALTQCHAKVAVAVGEEWVLSCVGSANFSRNPRLEAGIISADREVGLFHKSWIEENIDNEATR